MADIETWIQFAGKFLQTKWLNDVISEAMKHESGKPHCLSKYITGANSSQCQKFTITNDIPWCNQLIQSYNEFIVDNSKSENFYRHFENFITELNVVYNSYIP